MLSIPWRLKISIVWSRKSVLRSSSLPSKQVYVRNSYTRSCANAAAVRRKDTAIRRRIMWIVYRLLVGGKARKVKGRPSQGRPAPLLLEVQLHGHLDQPGRTKADDLAEGATAEAGG